MNNFKYIFLILCFYVSSAHAQFKVGFKDEDIKDLKRRKLLVVLEEDDEKLIKKLIKKDKPEELEEYKRKLASYNNSLQAAVKKNWKYNTKIEYTTETKLDNMDKEKLKDQCLVLRGGVMVLRGGGFEIANPGKMRYLPKFPLDFTMQKSDWDKEKIIKKGYDPDWTQPYSLVICKYSKILGKLICEPVHNVCLPSYNPTTSDITLALLILQEDMNKKRQRLKESRAAFLLNHQKLKEKPLLIKKSQVSSQNSIKELGDNYAHKLEVVEDSIFDRMILTVNTSYYYLYTFCWVSPWVDNRYGFHRILDISKPMTVGLQQVGHGFVTADIVKSYGTSKDVTQEEEEEEEEEKNEKKKDTKDKKKGKD